MTTEILSFQQPISATLRQVAAWDLDHLNSPCEIKASVPALQRGLVWSPQQVEMLWDSILRGFPIGSLVVSAQVPEQERSGKSGITHHLLDGQQRCNAITLGFHDPFKEAGSKVRGNASESILWLDIAPDGIPSRPHSQIPKDSTREFLTRVTTLAHPWGYLPNDAAGTLGAAEAKKTVEWEFEGKDKPKQRPHSRDLSPSRSNAPVPLAWLIQAMTEKDCKLAGRQDFWQAVTMRLRSEASFHRWPNLTLEALDQGVDSRQLNAIYRAMTRVLQTRLVILEAPSDILRASQQERSAPAAEHGNISSIEHLFNRLNRQGKVLDGEELAYSLIKAYWPGVADVVDAVTSRRVPASHLVSLGVRAALTDPHSGKMARGVTIPRLRAIATAAPPSDGGAASSAYELRVKIESFLSIGADGDRLARACAKVDEWLSFDPASVPHGLPPVLVSSLARGSADIYLFLLHLADRLRSNDQAMDADWKKLLPGLASLFHWFSKPGEQLMIADQLLASVADQVSPEAVRRGIALVIAAERIVVPLQPSEVKTFIKIPSNETLKHWSWWPSLIESGSEETKSERENHWKPFLEHVAWSREMLLYAQRSYLNQRFPTYDPSRRDLWESHNRPWDFDHLHASAYFYKAKSGDYADVCRQWGNCIGNLRAWPFEDNRSDQKSKAKEKIGGEPDLLAASLIESEVALEAFSHGDNARHDVTAAHALCEAVKDRFIFIYQTWYESMGMSSLLPSVLKSASDIVANP